jgi:hypothetical protein
MNVHHRKNLAHTIVVHYTIHHLLTSFFRIHCHILDDKTRKDYKDVEMLILVYVVDNPINPTINKKLQLVYADKHKGDICKGVVYGP